MVIYYVDWWDEDDGLIRRHFGTGQLARQHFSRVKKTSSGSTKLYKVELRVTKAEFIDTLNHLWLKMPEEPYPNSIVLDRSPPSSKVLQSYVSENP